MKKIQVKIEGIDTQELMEILSNSTFDKTICFEIVKAENNERNFADIVNFVSENWNGIATIAGTIYGVWKAYINFQKLRLQKQKHQLNLKKYELDKKKFETEQEKINKPKSLIIQTNYGDDLILPFNFKSQQDFKNYLKSSPIQLDAENIKSIYFK
jgi:hypothetical protein